MEAGAGLPKHLGGSAASGESREALASLQSDTILAITAFPLPLLLKGAEAMMPQFQNHCYMALHFRGLHIVHNGVVIIYDLSQITYNL